MRPKKDAAKNGAGDEQKKGVVGDEHDSEDENEDDRGRRGGRGQNPGNVHSAPPNRLGKCKVCNNVLSGRRELFCEPCGILEAEMVKNYKPFFAFVLIILV